MRIQFCRTALLCLMLAIRAFAPTNGAAQTIVPSGPAIHLSSADARSFTASLQSLAQQGQVGFVVEGRPLRDELPPEKASLLAESAANLPELAAKVAAAFDYDLEQNGKLFVLRKRYSDPQDIPEVTFDECLFSLREVLRVGSALNPYLISSARNTPLDGIIATLTPNQFAELKEGIPISRLSAAQQAAVWRYALYGYVQMPLQEMERTLNQMERAAQNDSSLTYRQNKGLLLFGIDIPAERGQPPCFISLNHPNQVSANSETVGYRISEDGKVLPPDPTKPIPSAASRKLDSEFVKPLGEWIDVLNKRQPTDALPLFVDDELASKKAMLIGCERETPFKVFQSLANLYSLRLKTDYTPDTREATPSGYRLARFRGRAVQNAADLPKEIQRVFPASLWRIAQRQFTRRNAIRLGSDPQPIDLADRNESKRLKTAAVLALRTRLEPKIATAKEGRIFVNELEPDERNLLGIILIADMFSTVERFAADTPPAYISNFQTIHLAGRLAGQSEPLTPGQPREYSMALCTKGEEGRLYLEIATTISIRPNSTLAEKLELK